MCSCGIPLEVYIWIRIVVYPTLPSSVVGHDRAIDTSLKWGELYGNFLNIIANLNDIAKSVVCTARRCHPPVMCQSKPMSNFMAKAVIPQSTSLPDSTNCVARSNGVEVVDTTDSTTRILIDKKNGGVS